MTDDEIKAVVTRYIIGAFESDNADCLHEMDEFYLDENDETAANDVKRAYNFYNKAVVTVDFE